MANPDRCSRLLGCRLRLRRVLLLHLLAYQLHAMRLRLRLSLLQLLLLLLLRMRLGLSLRLGLGLGLCLRLRPRLRRLLLLLLRKKVLLLLLLLLHVLMLLQLPLLQRRVLQTWYLCHAMVQRRGPLPRRSAALSKRPQRWSHASWGHTKVRRRLRHDRYGSTAGAVLPVQAQPFHRRRRRDGRGEH